MGFLEGNKTKSRKKSSKKSRSGTTTKKDENNEKVPLMRSGQMSVVVSETSEDPFQNEIKSLVKDIEDDLFKDDELIVQIENRIANNSSAMSPLQTTRMLRDVHTGYDNWTLLHFAAKNFRVKLCEYLIEKISISK